MQKNRIISTIAAGLMGLSALGTTAIVMADSASASTATVMSVRTPTIAPLFGTWHKMTVTLNGTVYTGYWVYMVHHADGLLTGWLYDGNSDTVGVPGYLPLHGSYADGVVQFNAKYANGDPQGDRAFVGIVNPGHLLQLLWNETGPEGGSGTAAFVS